MIKNDNNDLFCTLDYVLKKSFKTPQNNSNLFLTNRWISMASESTALIINHTTNKWCNKLKDFNFISFYRKILPRHNKDVKYIKKSNVEKDEECEDIKNISNVMECSLREIRFHNKTLEELNNNSN